MFTLANHRRRSDTLNETCRNSPGCKELHEKELVVPNPAFEIVVRELQHITGPAESGESGQKYQPQHGTPRRLRVSWPQWHKKFGLQTRVVAGPSSALQKAAGHSEQGRDWKRKGTKEEEVKMLTSSTASFRNHSVAASHWPIRCVALTNEISGNRASTRVGQSGSDKSPYYTRKLRR